jgi:Fe-S-cluster-containing dehydrogenase component/anaerobic selenocysteine-containing dehydrogenase
MSDHDPLPPSSADELILPVERDGSSRRTFLKLAGFGVASASLAGCSRGAARFVVPRLEADSGITPGLPYLTATTCGGCEARCGILARCRDGRPVKLEGNPDHAISRGGLCAVGQASLLELYDGQRLDGAIVDGKSVAWQQADDAVRTALEGARVRVLTRTITSPSTRALIERFARETGGAHVEWDPRSASAILDAHAKCFGARVLPRMRFDRARVIASFDADFLGTWLSPVEFARDYAAGRRPDGEDAQMSRHIHVESHLSLTGSAADERLTLAPSQLRPALAVLAKHVEGHSKTKTAVSGEPTDAPHGDRLEKLAEELWEARGASLVVCGSDDPGAQALTVHINQMLGSYGTTLDVEQPSLVRRGDDAALHALVAEMRSGAVDVLIVDGLDLAYELPDDAGVREALAQVGTIISTASLPDETSALAAIIAPTPHELESWNDAEPARGHLSLSQPTVPPLRSARTLRRSLAVWLGDDVDDLDLVKAHWRGQVQHRTGRSGDFDAFFDRVLHDGYVAAPNAPRTRAQWRREGVSEALASAPPRAIDATSFALVLYSKVGLPEARNAHNPWLQELPDPLTTLVWDNYACMSPGMAAKLGVRPGDVVRIADGDNSIEVPVRTLPGIDEQTVAVALGYGVSGTDRFSRIGPSWLEGRLTVREGETVGSRAASLLQFDAGGMRASGRPVTVTATGAHEDLAGTQDHHRLEVPKKLAVAGGAVRNVVLATSFETLQKDPANAIHSHGAHEATMWPADHANSGPRYGMAIDLSACNGCSGCVVACQAENNVPSVGKDEVLRHREMTWLRMDRYFQGTGKALRVYHQPMMCHHCANAPCETVCPVLATAHSADGLNQQVYNRCVGTRYCANNCPYKVRRFNWFDYPRGEELRNLALNPDVTVRSRGVMEKCSMCVQRIQEGKAEATRRGEDLRDGEVQTACQQSCPTNAIVFGDLNDPESAVAKLAHSPRTYQLLSELNVAPGVSYLADVRNAPEPESATATGESHG